MTKSITNKTERLTAPNLTLTAKPEVLAQLKKAVKTETPTADQKAKTHHNTNGKAVEVTKGSELDTVLKAVINKGGMTATEIGKQVRFKYAPQRALKRLVKMGLVKKSKDKTFSSK